MKSANTAWDWTIAELGRKVEPMQAVASNTKARNFGEKILAARSAKSRALKTIKA